MDKEIQSLEQKIVALNEENQKLQKIIKEYELKKEKTKGKNELFCELCNSFLKKQLKSSKINMIIGMYIKKYEKETEKKYSKFVNQEKVRKNQITDLVSEIYYLKNGKEIPSTIEEHQKEFYIDHNEIISQSEGENEKQIKILE